MTADLHAMIAEYYAWIKALHIIAVISWMAGLLYLPRLFVYHCQAEPGSRQSDTFKVMESRLLTVIMRPAMIVSWLSGLVLLWIIGYPNWNYALWVYGKLVLVVALTGTHIKLAGHARRFAEDRNAKPEKYFRIINEVPTLIMIGIVILVTVKPF